MKKFILTATALGALTLAPFAPAVQADDQRQRGGVAVRSQQLDDLAYRLHDATQDLKRQVVLATHRRGNGHGYGQHRNTVDKRTVRLVIQLERDADRFLDAVNRRNLRQIERLFDGTADTFEQVADVLDHVRNKRIREEFRQVARLMDRVDRNVLQARGYGHGNRNDDHEVYRPSRPVRTSGQIVLGDTNGRGRFQVRIGW